MMFIYNFPEHKDVPEDEGQTLAQCRKIIEEARETRSEALMLERYARLREAGGTVPEGVVKCVRRRMMQETLDTIHACETLLRAFPAAEVAKERNRVIAKNGSRGYYGGRPHRWEVD